MKKILSALFIVSLLCISAKVYALNYSAALSTRSPVNTSSATWASVYPTISGGVKIDNITFSTTDTVTSAILISVYDNAGTTITAVANGEEGYWIMPSSPTVSGAQTFQIEQKWPYYNPRTYTDPVFYMKANGTGIKVYINVDYR